MVPVIVIAELLRVRGAVPVLFSVICCVAAWVPTGVPWNVRLPADKLTAGARPVPLSATCCGEPAALSAIFSVAISGPPAVGLKLSVITQLPLAATLVPHVLVFEKKWRWFRRW